MGRTIESSIPSALERQRRVRALASSRRQVREQRDRWRRRSWLACLIVVAFAGGAPAIVHVFIGGALAPYLVGALIASAGWMIHVLMLRTSGIALTQAGILAEEWTAGELRQLWRSGWFTLDHVMLEHRDVDHVLLGPGGFFTLESKFRSDWSRDDLGAIARRAVADARAVDLRAGFRTPRFTPMVVMWGPGIEERFPDVFHHEGAIFCPGGRLRAFFRYLPPDADDGEVAAAFGKLDDYVRRRESRVPAGVGRA